MNSFDAQNQLGLYCKTGKGEPKTSIQENTHHYRRLVINIGYDTISRAYPLTKSLIGGEQMNTAIEFFYEKHSAKTAQVWKLPYEFYEFYNENEFPFKHEYPFLVELLLFEWLEIEVFMMPDEHIQNYKPITNKETDNLVCNPEIAIQPLQYPLHKKKNNEITEADKGQYLVSMHRDVVSKQVKFNELSLPMVLFLQQAMEQDVTWQTLVSIVENYARTKVDAITYADELLAFGLETGIILGAKE